MRVLYYHQHFSTRAGSTGTRSYEFAQRLLARGHSVTMVCGSYSGGKTGLTSLYSNGARRGVVDGIDVIEFELPYSNRDRFLKRSLTFLSFAWKSTLLAFREKYDVLFATTTPLTAGIPGICAAFLGRRKFVFEVRDLWPELPREMGVIRNPVILAALSALEWMSYRSAWFCIGLSPGIVKGIRRLGVPPTRVRMIPNGCDLSLFGAEAAEPWRPEGVKENDLMAVFTGTHGVANGLEAVLDACVELQCRGRDDIKIVLVGDGGRKAQLVESAKAAALQNCIFLPPMPKAELSGLMRAADVGLMILADVPAFYYGTSPNKFFDYIAAGLPILTNYPGWVADMVTERSCGVAVPPRSAAIFADALERLASDRIKLPTMGRNGRRLAEEQFDRIRLADEFVDVLEKCHSDEKSI